MVGSCLLARYSRSLFRPSLPPAAHAIKVTEHQAIDVPCAAEVLQALRDKTQSSPADPCMHAASLSAPGPCLLYTDCTAQGLCMHQGDSAWATGVERHASRPSSKAHSRVPPRPPNSLESSTRATMYMPSPIRMAIVRNTCTITSTGQSCSHRECDSWHGLAASACLAGPGCAVQPVGACGNTYLVPKDALKVVRFQASWEPAEEAIQTYMSLATPHCSRGYDGTQESNATAAALAVKATR